jgi:hypothetical protein
MGQWGLLGRLAPVCNCQQKVVRWGARQLVDLWTGLVGRRGDEVDVSQLLFERGETV